MTLKLDHVVIAVQNLDEAINDYRELGFTVNRGGVHANRATENALIVFSDGTYIELLAATGEEALPGLIDFSPMLQAGEGLKGFALLSDDLDADIVRLRADGFKVEDAIPGERRRQDGTVIQWKLALIDGGFTPFLIQDVTSRNLRVPTDDRFIFHINRSVGLKSIKIAVQSVEEIWNRYVTLMDVDPKVADSCCYKVNEISLVAAPSWQIDEQPPDYLKMFSGHASQEEIDAADPALEPATFVKFREGDLKSLARWQKRVAEERALVDILQGRLEVLFALGVVRDQGEDEHFTLDKTHDVRFEQFTGTLPSQGEGFLSGLDQVDWKSLSHAYGAATDVPQHLRELTSDDAEVRSHAYQDLYGSILHQGSVYSASVEAIPFLMQLLDAPSIEDKINLLYLLGGIVTGSLHEPYLRERTRSLLKDVFPIYLNQMDQPDRQLRRLIAEHLGVYPDKIDTLEPLLRTRIMTDPDISVRGDWVEALGHVWRSSAPDTDLRKLTGGQIDYLAALLKDLSHPFAVRFHAAVVLLSDDTQCWIDEAMTIFHEMMHGSDADVASLDSSGWIGGVFHQVVDLLDDYPEHALEWIIAQSKHPMAKVRQEVPTFLERLIHQGIEFNRVLPSLRSLLRDPSPDVRQHALIAFHTTDYRREFIDILQDLAENDPSLNIRVLTRNALNKLS